MDRYKPPPHFPKPKFNQKWLWVCSVVFSGCHPSQLSESSRNDYDEEVLPINWWNPLEALTCRPQSSQYELTNYPSRQRTAARRTTDVAKVERIGLRYFASPSILSGPFSHWLPFYQHYDKFLDDKCYENKDDAKNGFNDFRAFRKRYIYSSHINKLIFLGRNVSIRIVIIFLTRVISKRNYVRLKLLIKTARTFSTSQ